MSSSVARKVLFFCLFVFIFCRSAFAEELVIVFTGNSHAMLYPCNCPNEPDGGIARRLTLIKQLRTQSSNFVLLDTGVFFAGGPMDQYAQNTQLDLERSKINLKAMELAGYDAVAIGDAEFNFGRAALEEILAQSKISFVSANIESDKTAMYVLKTIGRQKIGIVGVTDNSSAQKAGGLKFIAPQTGVKKAVSELKKKGAQVIIVLSNLAENEDSLLLKENPEIDVLISNMRSKPELSEKIGKALVVRTSWQARRLGKIALNLKEGKVLSSAVEELRLSDQIADDKEALKILPRCFSDLNCVKEGASGSCQNGGTAKASCEFTKANKVSLLIVTPQLCKVCNTEVMLKSLKKSYPGLETSFLYYPEEKAKKLVRDFGIKFLPAYLLGKEIEKENNFESVKANLEAKGNYYLIKPHISGIAYFVDRPKIKEKLDLFFSLYNKDAYLLLERVKEFNPDIHFLAIEQQDGFHAENGPQEVEEDLRAVCVQKHYPGYFYNYISCRAYNIGSSWWEDCLQGLDSAIVKRCAKSEEGLNLLRANASLNKELEVAAGPTYLINNQEIFGSVNVPSKEELRKIITGK